MGMARSKYVLIVEKVFTCLMRRMSESAQDVGISFSYFPDETKREGKNGKQKGLR